jgi:hypothetical protein
LLPPKNVFIGKDGSAGRGQKVPLSLAIEGAVPPQGYAPGSGGDSVDGLPLLEGGIALSEEV